MDSIIALWNNTLERFPDKCAFIYEGKGYSFHEIDKKIQNFASNLRERFGAEQGCKVALVMPNCLELIIAYLGVIKTGAMALPLNIRLKPQEMRFIIDDADASTLVVHKDLWNTLKEALEGSPNARRLIAVGMSAEEADSFDEMVSSSGVSFTPPSLRRDDVAAIIYTSGTTGLPKGAMLTHGNIIFNTYSCELGMRFSHDEVHLIASPLFAVTGLNSILITSIRLGSTVVVAPWTKPTDIAKLIEQHRINTFLGVPTMFTLMTSARGIGGFGLPSMRVFGYAGAPMPVTTIYRLHDIFPHIELQNFYGLTETTSITTVLSPQDTLKALASEPAESSDGGESERKPRLESIGKAAQNLELKLIDDEGNDLPTSTVDDRTETIGELCVKGDSVFKGYLNRPEATEEAIVDGWFRTGDFAVIDDEGYVFLMGRKKELIIVGGLNVYAVEVENVLCSHDKVLEAAVVGAPQKVLGEVVKAVVVPMPGEHLTDRDVKQFCAQRLATYKVPHTVEFVDDLPRNPSGKVLKREL